MYKFSVLLYIFILSITGIFCKDQESAKEIAEFDRLLKEENGLAVIFTQPCCACTDCVEAEVLLGGMSKELEDNLNIFVVRLKEPSLRARYGIKKIPALIYIRDNKTALYDGTFDFETVYSWLQDNRQPSTVDLDDASFEHMTQAASGATTGDWLVIFHDGSCCKGREFMHLETAGTKLRNKVNVAAVNTLEASETAARFKISSCPEVILFHHQRMYRFSLLDITSKTLVRFADGFYKNSKAERVPLPSSLFDKITDKTLQFCIDHWYSMAVVLAVTTVCATLLLICTVLKPSTHRKKD